MYRDQLFNTSCMQSGQKELHSFCWPLCTYVVVTPLAMPHDIINNLLQAGGLLRSPPAAPDSDTFHPHSYISAHIYMHAIRCCKQGCERADLAHMKSSKERVKGTDYVNSTSLILQYIVNLQ